MRLTRLISTAIAWPVTSQRGARRNALLASTALTQRRIERDEVRAFVAGHAAKAETHPAEKARTA